MKCMISPPVVSLHRFVGTVIAVHVPWSQIPHGYHQICVCSFSEQNPDITETCVIYIILWRNIAVHL